ncbi:MAG TPA: ABC transporter substrate-binding protein [Candidatus Binatia bacterium]|nr:ABC transporter substrate-binding protein [Candidatus Binatia bacterium]
MREVKPTRTTPIRFALTVFLFGSLLCHSVSLAADAGRGEAIKIGYASISGNRISFWAAQDAGFFARHGLAPELVFIATSAQGMPALLAGDLSMFVGSPETAAQAAVRGVDLIVVASSEPTQYKLVVQPGLKTVSDLKGKKIGIDRIGGSSYYATRRILEKLGLKPEEVEFMQVAGGGVQRAAAFRSGVLSGVVTTVERLERSKIPYHVMADAVSMGIRVIGSSVIVTRSFRDRNRHLILGFVRALSEAAHWTKNPKNREAVGRVFAHFLRTDDPAILDLNYRLYVDSQVLFPHTNIDDLRSNLWDLGENNPKLRELNLSELVDNSFVQRVEAESRATQR